jgi:multidrug resistance protein, MATE family
MTMTHAPCNPADTTYTGIAKLAAPLILTMSSFMLMNFVDALLLSWYSTAAIAAVVPAGMAFHLMSTVFTGTVGYTSVLVSQYYGAGRPDRVAPVVWQGIYLAVISGGMVAMLSLAGKPLFAWVGHDPSIRAFEVDYFTILCWGAPFYLLGQAVAGFFSGRRITMPILFAQSAAMAVNAVLDWVLIFGRWGFPEMGVAGVAWATVAGQAVAAVVFLVLFLDRKNRKVFGSWLERGLNLPLTRRLIVFGFPNGSRYVVEVLAWTAFVFFVGRLGESALAATNIAWRINGLAFFPVIGLSQAIGILVGNAQGEKRPDISVRVTWRGIAIGQAWMMTAAGVFVLFPRLLYGLFAGDTPPAEFGPIVDLGVMLLRFVALYTLLDGFNIMMLTTLQSAGDTKWTFVASLILHILFLAALTTVDRLRPAVIVEWLVATAFVMIQAFFWSGRFLSGKWREIQVVE